jgi:hypothetical protein
MELHDLSGYYTFRSFLNNPLPVSDFNRIKFEEAELFLIIHYDGIITGTISFPAEQEASEKMLMDLKGNVKSWQPVITLEFIGRGRTNTKISEYLFKYSCSVTQILEKDAGQRLSLNGTVSRDQNRNTSEQIAKDDTTTVSFVAVKRDFIEPREIDKVAIIPTALSMLASKSHRLKHAVWHTVRIRGVWFALNDNDKTMIRNLGWGLDRPPFNENNELNLSNGAGEDFLFMHRKMITMVNDEYDLQGISRVKGWKALPHPDIQQFFYEGKNDPKDPEKKIYFLNMQESGNMVPAPYLIPTDNKEEDLENLRFLKFLKSHDYFNNVMNRLERIFKNKTFLSTLTLGELGNLLEFEIHNQMHIRWSSISRDPQTGEPAERGLFDFDNKWDDPKYDSLGDFYSSHVNPLFWRLHGWIDDRIEDWFKSHEETHPGEIKRYDYKGVKWFKPGKWVKVSKPFYWPEHNHNHHADSSKKEEIAMLKVLEIIRRLFEPENISADTSFIHRFNSGSLSFMHDIKLDNK